jgi:single-strand DNA-binding protein
MSSFNRVTMIANLTRDPQSKVLPSQTSLCEFGVAMNRRFRTQAGEDREEVCFVDCSAFGKQAEVIQQYCKKGKQLFIEGRLKYDTWDDKNGGGKRSKLSVVVENFQFLGGRDGERVNHGEEDQTQVHRKPYDPSMRQRVAARPKAEDPIGEGQEFDSAEIPF